MAVFLYSELEGRIFCGCFDTNDAEALAVSLVCGDDLRHHADFVVMPTCNSESIQAALETHWESA
jgi:hypothetical protein